MYGVQSVLKFVNEVFQISSLEQDVNYPKYYKKVFRIYSVPRVYKTMEKQIIARFWTVSQLVWNREVALWFLASLKVNHNMEPSLLLYTNYKLVTCLWL